MGQLRFQYAPAEPIDLASRINLVGQISNTRSRNQSHTLFVYIFNRVVIAVR